jgi:cytidyltransferase-like protein
MSEVIVSGSFDGIRSPQMRFLQEVARLGDVHVLLWSDEIVRLFTGGDPKFPQEERCYVLDAIRYIKQVTLVDQLMSIHALPLFDIPQPAAWVVAESENHGSKRAFCQMYGIAYHVIPQTYLAGFPILEPESTPSGTPDGDSMTARRKKALVTGCFDWLHSGHVRFFEEVSQLGDLYVVVGSDENVRLLKGTGHPLFGQEERRYMVQSIRHVTQALVSTGTGWMDAEPEIERIRPDIYAVNQDGDKPEKRAFCEEHGLEYAVLKRLPKEGLPRRESTNLRGF